MRKWMAAMGGRDVRGERGDRDLLWVAMEYSMEEFALFVSLDSFV